MKTGFRNAIVAAAFFLPASALAANGIIMHRDPGCGCCTKWAAEVQKKFGRKVAIVDSADRPAFREGVGVPADLGSCHTAIVDGMVFEGHVPVADMKRVLAAKPTGVRGLAVSGMPLGSPGMEVPGMKAQAYTVVAFGPTGRRVFARHSY